MSILQEPKEQEDHRQAKDHPKQGDTYGERLIGGLEQAEIQAARTVQRWAKRNSRRLGDGLGIGSIESI